MKNQNFENTQIIFLNTVSLPIRTGPSFTGVIRAKYFQSKGFDLVLIFPYLSIPEHQSKCWGFQMSREEYVKYLSGTYNTTIPIVTYNSVYHLGCQLAVNINEIYENVRPHLKHPHKLIIEDPEPIYFSNIKNDFKGLFIDKFDHIIGIHHTQYTKIALRKKEIPEEQILNFHHYFYKNYLPYIDTLII